MDLDRRCARCGKPEWTEDQKEQIRMDLLLHDGTMHELVAPDNWLIDIPQGGACWSCLSLQEQRRENFQCERCGTQFHDDGRDSDAGWIVDSMRILCPECQTTGEEEADLLDFQATVEEGKRRCEAEGREYPPDLALKAEQMKTYLARRQRQTENFERRFMAPPG